MRILMAVYLLVAIAVGVQSVMLGMKTFSEGGRLYTQYNNYVIFKYSFFHLLSKHDLYQTYPSEYLDLYKYSPAFALFFGFFSWMPDTIGLILWNLLNTLVLFAGIRSLPGLDDKKKNLLLLFCLPELILSIQNSQSNALIAGLLLLAFGLLERSRFILAALCIVLTVYIKIFGVAAFALFFLYPHKPRFAVALIFWSLLLAVLPAAAIGFRQLFFLYGSWWQLLSSDHSASIGISVMGILQSWFHLEGIKNGVMAAGVVLFFLPFFRIDQYRNLCFRLEVLASILIWTVIFNHKAESPSFIIAMGGMGIWYFSQRKDLLNLLLLVLGFIFTALAFTDLCPRGFKEGFIKPYHIKALFPLLIWMKLTFDLVTARYKPAEPVMKTAGG